MNNVHLAFRIITTAIGVASIVSAASLTHVEDVNVMTNLIATQVPKWSHGSFVTIQFKDPKYPLIWTLSRSGNRSVPFSVPAAESTLLYDCDRSSDGTIALSGSAADSDGRVAGFVAWISPSDTNASIVRTGLYRPAMVAIAPDGTLWAVGSQVAAYNQPQTIVPNAGVIQHFDRSGRTLNSFVPQSTIQNPLLALSRTRNTLRAAKDRIAWLSVGGRYVEISLTGNVIMDTVIALPKSPGKQLSTDDITFALTDEGDAFISVPYETSAVGGTTTVADAFETYVLDKSVRAWKPVQVAGSARSGVGHIYGVEGDRLVVNGGRITRFYAIGK